MYSLKTILLILFFLGINSFNLHSQESKISETNYFFDNITVKEGLSQSSVLSIHQDYLGFMWFGTRDGLNRYDGYNFKVFRNQVGDRTSISGNIIKDIKEDSKGNIWIATEKGISKYDRNLESFFNYSLSNFSKSQNPKIEVIFLTKKDAVLIGGNFGLATFDPNSKKISNIDFDKYPTNTPKKYYVNTIENYSNNRLLIATAKKGIFVFNLLHQKLTPLTSNQNQSIKITKTQAIVVKDSTIWVGTYGNGLYKLNNRGNVLEHYHTNATNLHYKLSDDYIRTLVIDSNDIWIGTFKGLNVLKNDTKITTINYDKGNLKGLPHNSVRSLYKDRKGSIWIGTYFGGVSIYDIHNQRFKHLYSITGNNTSLSFDVIGAFEEDNNDNIFIGTERGGLNLYKAYKNEHKKISDYIGSQSIIKSLKFDSRQKLWVGVFKKGLHFFDEKKEQLISVTPSQPSVFSELKDAIINCIVSDIKNQLWIGTDRKGLQKFDPAKKQYVNYSHQKKLNEIVSNNPIKSIATYNEHLYIATKGSGIIKFDTTKGTIEQLIVFNDNNTSFKAKEFNHISVDSEGLLWLSTNGKGLIKYNPKTKQCMRWHTVSGLESNIILGTLHTTSTKDTWVITTNMIAKINFNQKKINKKFSYTSGFPLEEINEGAFFKTNDGEFLIGGSNGYVKFNPNKIGTNTFSPQPIITSLKLFNKRVTPNDASNILSHDINKTSKITLDYSQSVFSLEFASLNYLRPENNQYTYMLKGFDNNWIYANTLKEVTYTNLPSGDYTFLVKSANNDNIWNDIPLELQITILPPPWLTWWAYIIYALLIGFIFYLIRYYAIKSTQLKNDLRIEQIEKEKWKEIHDLKLKYFIDVSHEFRTPLTLILAPLEEIIGATNQDNWLRSRIKIMYFNAKRLSLLINQILEIREIETGHSNLKQTPIHIRAFIEDIAASFMVIADKKKIALSIKHHNISERPLLADKDKLEKIFFNLLSNAFKFTPEGGKITLQFEEVDDTESTIFSFKVSDTGIGISKNKLTRIFDRFYKEDKTQLGAGIGLSLTKSLIELMNGTISATSEEGKGTSFHIKIPFNVTSSFEYIETTNKFVKPIPLEYEDTLLLANKQINLDQVKDTILIAEDNEQLRNYLKEQLENSYTVLTTKNGLQASQKIKRNAPDIVISDVMMPEMDGFELCKFIKQTKEICHIPVILLTAKDSQLHRIEGLENGADDYISKPFNSNELKTRIKNIIHNRNLLQEKFRSNELIPKLQNIKINSYDQKLMKNIVKTITEQFDKPNFTVDYLSSEVNLSKAHLTRKLKALVGMTPAEYIKDFRMRQAIKMLKSGAFKIADIAYAVGYQDVQYFSKTFKAKYGKSPAKYVVK